MSSRCLPSMPILALILSLPLAALAKGETGSCKTSFSGGIEQPEKAYGCRPELRKLGGAWRLIINYAKELPVELALVVAFEAQPVAKKTHALATVENLTLLASVKHDKSGDSWSASASKKPSKLGPRKKSPPLGSLTLTFSTVGPEPAAHGSLEATLKPSLMNKNKKDVVLKVTF